MSAGKVAATTHLISVLRVVRDANAWLPFLLSEGLGGASTNGLPAATYVPGPGMSFNRWSLSRCDDTLKPLRSLRLNEDACK